MRGGLGDRGKGGGRRVINALVINKRERGEEVSLLRARLLTTVVEISFVGCAARSLRTMAQKTPRHPFTGKNTLGT